MSLLIPLNLNSIERWRELSFECPKNLNIQDSYLNSGLKKFRTFIVASLVAGIALILIKQSIFFVIMGGAIAFLGSSFGMYGIKMISRVRSLIDWKDYSNPETIKTMTQFWKEKKCIQDFYKELIEVIVIRETIKRYSPYENLASINSFENLKKYGVVSSEKFQKIWEFIRNYHANRCDRDISEAEKQIKATKMEKEWPSIFDSFVQDFPDFKNI